MFINYLKYMSLAALILIVQLACTGGGTNWDNGSKVRVTIAGQYEKRDFTGISSSGPNFGLKRSLPTRYGLAIVDYSGGKSEVVGLDSNGLGQTKILQGSKFRVTILADIAVPGSPVAVSGSEEALTAVGNHRNDSSFEGTVGSELVPDEQSEKSNPTTDKLYLARRNRVNNDIPLSGAATGYSNSIITLHGAVLNSLQKENYTWNDYKNELLNNTWGVTSNDYIADSDGTCTVLATENTPCAGAFAMADQMVEYARFMQKMEPGRILPDFTFFWTAGTFDSNPQALKNGDYLIWSAGGSISVPIMASEVYMSKSFDWRVAAYNDSRLLEVFARSQFAVGSSFGVDNKGVKWAQQMIRGDNDNALVDLGNESEPSIAFIDGFSHFLSCSMRRDSHLYDVTINNMANTTLDLNSIMITSPNGGEYIPIAVAKNLWRIRNNMFNDTDQCLKKIWDASMPDPKMNEGKWEYRKAVLACYPTFLVGFTRRSVPSSASAGFKQLLKNDNIGNNYDVTDPNSNYYVNNGPFKSLNVGGSKQNVTLNLRNANSRLYDLDQVASFMTTTNGTRDYNVNFANFTTTNVELLVEFINEVTYKKKEFNVTTDHTTVNLDQGNYTVRVRLRKKQSTADKSVSFDISIN